MRLFELIIVLLVAAAALALLADRLKIPFPALLALGGAGLALLPAADGLTRDAALDPDLALALFVAPTLLDAAHDTSPRDLRARAGPVAGLALGATMLTAALAAATARLVVPALGWWPAIALGAIVAPPDASAAVAVLRRVAVPFQVATILEGESLLNDAAALLLYRVAVGAACGTLLVQAGGWPMLLGAMLLTIAASAIAGMALAWLATALLSRVRPLLISILLQFLTCFVVWIAATEAGLSAVITTVLFAMTLSHLNAKRQSIAAWRRFASYTAWDVAVFILNLLAFVLVGLQLRGILARLHGGEARAAILCAAAVLVAVVAARFLWLAICGTASLFWRTGPASGWREDLLIGWCGMRGIVTLPAALALPERFTHRDLAVLVAFAVVLGTLVLQGMTLGPMAGLIRLQADDVVGREVLLARRALLSAALSEIDRLDVRGDDADARLLRMLRDTYAQRLAALGDDGTSGMPAAPTRSLKQRIIATQRATLLSLRTGGHVGMAAFMTVEAELDRAEMGLQDPPE